MKHLMIIHTVKSTLETLEEQIKAAYPEEIVIDHLYDSSLARVEIGSSPEALEAKRADHLSAFIHIAEADNADLILIACSTLSQAAEKLRGSTDIPLICIDDAALDICASSCDSVTLFASSPNPLPGVKSRLQERAERLGRSLQIYEALCEDALPYLLRDDREGYGNALLTYAAQGGVFHGTVLLAQNSTAFIKDELEGITGCKVIAFTQPCIAQVIDALSCANRPKRLETKRERAPELIALGTMLMDLSPHGVSESGNPVYERNPGGSIGNFIVAAARQGARCAVVGKVGGDSFGTALLRCLRREQIDCASLLPGRGQTPCSVVTLGPNGERSFSFYHQDTADVRLRFSEVDANLIRGAKALHLTSFPLTSGAFFRTALACMDLARQSGVLISYDVNWRPVLWDSATIGRERVQAVARRCSILKVSEEELALLTGKHGKEAPRQLLDMGPKLVIVTYGNAGSAFFTKENSGFVKAESVQAVDTTGAGDCHFGVFMRQFIQSFSLEHMPDEAQLLHMLSVANHAAALSVQKRGGIPSMPYSEA